MRSSCRYSFLIDFRQRQWRISSTAILPTEDDTLTIYKLLTNLFEQINFRIFVRFRQNKTKQRNKHREREREDLTIMMIVAIIVVAITRVVVIIVVIITIIIYFF